MVSEETVLLKRVINLKFMSQTLNIHQTLVITSIIFVVDVTELFMTRVASIRPTKGTIILLVTFPSFICIIRSITRKPR